MPQIIEIEGGLARIITREVQQEVALADMMPFIENRPPITLPILPTRTRAIHWNPSNQNRQSLEVIIELDPHVRTLTLQADTGRTIENHRLALPFTIFHFRMHTTNPTSRNWSFDEYRCFFSNARLTNMDQKVIPALLPNIFDDGRICFGNTGADAEQTISDRLDQIVNEWYISNFNNIGHTRENYLPWNSRSFKKWEQETTADPNAWKKFPEWDENTPEGALQEHLTIKSLFDANLTRTEPIRLVGSIPDLPIVPTFGKAEEWALALDATQRYRLLTSLQNIQADNPAAFEIPNETPEEPEEEDFE